ncbi:MAG: hypothetical protein VSS75_011505 [Candidatus Parabeggiatoa sp.]|nr:hypothetical protein [Candidatus Parabeggiatoa sp.]
MYLKKLALAIPVFALLSLSFVNSAHAVPAFSRQQGVPCSNCHTAWPQLNETGRKFKELGYRFPEELDEEKSFSDLFEDGFPLSGIIAARPFDKKEHGDRKIRALHEAELIAAGALGAKWSGFMEIEAEDETDFKPTLAAATLNYNYNPALNVQVSWGPYLWSDGYGLLADHLRLTRGHVKVIDEVFGGADGMLRATRQSVGIYGRPLSNLFYNVGYSGIADDTEGQEASNLHARIAYDIKPGIMLGALSVIGENATNNQNFMRNSIDFQADIGDARIQGAYLRAEDDVLEPASGEEKNNAWSLQGMYVFKQGKQPTWVPLVRYDGYERADGKDGYDELTFNLTYYFSQNVKGYFEYWKQFDVPDDKTDDSRVTFQMSIGF